MTNCYYNGSAHLLTDETSLKALETACGMIYNGKDVHRDEFVICCCFRDDKKEIGLSIYLCHNVMFLL
jgi:hypothetical protein